MGCGAAVARPTTGNSKKPSTSANQRAKAQTSASEVPTLMASLQGHMPNKHIHGDDDTTMVHIIDISNGSFPEKMPPRIECDDIIEFQINVKGEYDIVQVYKDGNDFYRVSNGYELLHVKNSSPENERRLLLSLALNQPEIDLYFCIFPSSQRETILATRKCPKVNCETNCLKIQKCEIKFSLTDEKESQKVYIHKGDTVDLEWASKNNVAYRIEEKRYCPVSGGLYTIEQTGENISTRPTARGKFSKTFNDFGMSFLFRITETNQVHDITVCIVHDTYKVKHVEITDNNIQPNIIWIEQNDWIVFDWNTKRKQTVAQIEPFSIDENKRKPIELKTQGEHFYWPNETTRRGFMVHQFNETGLYCFKNGTNQIGTIIVEPHKTIHHIPVFGEKLIYQMNTKDLVQFDWKKTDSEEDPVFLTIDAKSSVVPDAGGGLTGIFDCATHRCTKTEPFFRHHFHTCEIFLLNIPQHGLYNFSSTDNRTNNLISLIVENGIDYHPVIYNENNTFEPHTLIINQGDQVWFDSSSINIASIHQTDEHGNQLDSDSLLFQPQENSINYFMKEFQQNGIFYFSTDISNEKDKNQENSATPLAVIVVPNITFHYRSTRKNDFDSLPILTNVNDFVIWQFDHIVSHNVIQLDSNERIQDLIASHERAIPGRNRQCLAVECMIPGTFFFANPEFERGTGSEQDRLISTVIIDPPFSQNCFIVTEDQFVPTILNIAQNDTVSWIVASNERKHQIYVQSNDSERSTDEDIYINRNIHKFVHDVHHLHTFYQPGQYTIRSNRFQTIATVNVHSQSAIRSQKRRVPEPQIVGEIDTVSQSGTQVFLNCPNRYAIIYYTLDGLTPTRHFDNVHVYDPDTGVILFESGLHVIRAYSMVEEKLPSTVITGSMTFVLESKEREAMNAQRGLWSTGRIALSTSIQQPNKVYGKIEVDPASLTDLIDHFKLCINGVEQQKTIPSTDPQFSAEGFAGGEQYEINVIAYPIKNIADVEPIPSNRQMIDIKREVQGGGPLISLSLSNDQNILLLMWAHIGDHVSQYMIYVDDIETKIITQNEFSEYYVIQFHGAQQKRRYVFHVDATITNSNAIRKSNTVAVTLPLSAPYQGSTNDRYFPYVTVNEEATPTDIPLETIQPNTTENPRPKPVRKIETLPITNGFRNALPQLSYKPNPKGVTLFWKSQSPAIGDSVENYRIMVDNQPYGKLIAPQEETKYQVNLSPGNHECYLEVIPKGEDEEIYRSNILKIDILPPTTPLKYEQKQQKEPADTPVYKVLEQKDIPIPKLNIQSINTSSIRANWYLDRPMPSDAFVALFEVHVRGEHFPEEIKSDEYSQQDQYTVHIWHTHNSPLEITGISDQQEYTIFVRAYFHVQGLTDIDYVKTTSNEVTTTRVDPLIDLLSRPLLKVKRVGLQTASLEWQLDDSVDEKLVKGYRIILNSKPTEILSSDQHEYELTGLKPDTENDVQVSVTSHPDFVDEKISELIRIVCPSRPQPPVIQSIKADKPFSIAIKWKIDSNDRDEISSFKIFLDTKLHEEIETNGRQSFKYDFNKLNAEKTYSIYIRSVIRQKKLEGYVYQCDIESNISNELSLRCAVPPKGTTPRLERINPNGVEISWDAPVEFGDVKLTGYQILKNERAIGKPLPADKRRASIKDLELSNRYSFQIVPITDQPGGTLFRTGEEYNSDRHGHYIPGAKLEVEYTDLIQLPRKFWIENISGHSALLCWSQIDESSSTNIRPDGYKLSIWNNQDLTRDKPLIIQLTTDKTSAQLKDLHSGTTYETELEAYKKRRHQTTNCTVSFNYIHRNKLKTIHRLDQYTVSTTSEIVAFKTGSPPDAPINLHLVACTNTDARISFDPFVENNAEVIIIRVQCVASSSEVRAKDISLDLTPDSTEFILTNLNERTDYTVTVYGITEEYLDENHCRDVGQLPKKLKPSDWLPNQSFEFQTSGCESVSQLHIRQATTESIQLDWTLPKVYGSTQYLSQVLHWKLEHGTEDKFELNPKATSATIPGPLLSGLYKVSLDSIFSVKINLEDNNDETSRKEICSTTTESIVIRFRPPGTSERPEIYLTGYTTNTIDLAWNKPNLFNIIDHPEKNNEQLRIHRRLLGYRVDINGRKRHTLDEDQYRCTLTDCQPGDKYEVQLITRTAVQDEYINEMTTNDKENNEQSDETPSKKLRVRMLKDDELLRSFQANFEFNHNETTTEQQKEVKSLGKIHLNWTVSDTKNISHFILQWRSSKDLQIQQKTVASNETSTTIDSCDEKYHYVIENIIVTNNGERHQFEQLTIPIPGEPDAPKLWLVKTSDTNFTIEWSEPKSYGIPVIGFQLFIGGKKTGDLIQVNLRRAEIPSRINRTYQVCVCAVTNNLQRQRSPMSTKLSVITTPTINLTSTMFYNNTDGSGSPTFDRNIARIIPLQIETINEEKLNLDWTSFLPTGAIRAYYIHYTCLNNGEVQAMKVSKQFRHTILHGLRPGFTYGIMIMAVDKNGGVLYTSDRSTVQMNAPPNAPIVNITERENTHVKLEWRPAASYGEVAVVGYKVFVNNRLSAILRHDQLTYTLTHGVPCDIYTVHVQALGNDKNTVSPISREVKFVWPGIKPGSFKRIDDGQIGNIIVAWEHPQLEDEGEKLLGYKLFSENISTHAERLHGEYDAATQQATIHDLANGKYRLWLEIQTERHRVRARPIVIITGRFNSLLGRQSAMDTAQCFNKKQRRLRSPVAGLITPTLRHVPYS